MSEFGCDVPRLFFEIQGGQFRRRSESEMPQEIRGRHVENRPARPFGAAGLLDQSFGDEIFQHAFGVYSADRIDLGVGQRLFVGKD